MKNICLSSALGIFLTLGCGSDADDSVSRPLTEKIIPDIDRVPAPLARVTACIFRVLKTIPGVHDARTGVAREGGWTHTYIEYRSDEKVGGARFDALRPDDISHGPYSFEAVLPGLVWPGQKGPDVHITREVVHKWKEQCGTSADMLFE